MTSKPRDERGFTGSMLVTGAILAIVSVVAVSCLLIAWFATIRRAEQVAELAALAAVSASVAGAEPCAAAAQAASYNQASIAGCQVRGSGRHVVVEVMVGARLEPALLGVPPVIERTATAGT